MQDTAAFGSRFRPSDLRDVQKKIHELAGQIEAAEYVLSRTEVRSPEAGVVTDLKFHTPGGAAVTALGVVAIWRSSVSISAGGSATGLLPNAVRQMAHCCRSDGCRAFRMCRNN